MSIPAKNFRRFACLSMPFAKSFDLLDLMRRVCLEANESLLLQLRDSLGFRGKTPAAFRENLILELIELAEATGSLTLNLRQKRSSNLIEKLPKLALALAPVPKDNTPALAAVDDFLFRRTEECYLK